MDSSKTPALDLRIGYSHWVESGPSLKVMRFALSNNPDHIAGKKKSWYLRGHNRLHRIASSTQRQDKVEGGAALEVVFRSCLVVRPNREQC